MAFVSVIPPSRAAGPLAAAYDRLRAVAGGVPAPNVMRVFSGRAASLQRAVRGWELAMWTGEEPRARRELVAAMVSRANDCGY